MPSMSKHIAVIGGGISGVLQSLALLRHPGIRVTLVERDAKLARGLAYSTPHQSHLLNVRACNMSAYADAPGHFAEWLQARHLGSPDDYVARTIYGDYLEDQLRTALAASDGRLHVVRGAALDLQRAGDRVRIAIDGQDPLLADSAVLALGHLRPHVLGAASPEALGGAYINDPWAGEISQIRSNDGTVLLAGTGMTMIDIALQLVDQGFGGTIIAVSRRGLLPLPHTDQAHPIPLREAPAVTPRLSTLVAETRAVAKQTGWRAAIDQLRPHLQSLWQAASTDEKSRFLRHLRPWWDIHRHRLAPSVSRRIEALMAEGRLTVVAAKFLAFERDDDGIRAHWRARGTDIVHVQTVSRVINCTGPGCDVGISRNPLLQNLLAAGTVRPGFARMGLDVTAHSQVIDSRGRPLRNLYALGPMTRGAFWEITAVPEIRTQTVQLAEVLAAPGNDARTPASAPGLTRTRRRRGAQASARLLLSAGH